MELVSKLINFVGRNGWLMDLLFAAALWLVWGLILCVVGAVALYRAGRSKGLKPYFAAFLPWTQIFYTLRLAERERLARIAEHFLWWCPVLVITAGAGAVWAAYFYVLNNTAYFLWTLIPSIVLAASAVGLYIALRVMELIGLRCLLKNWQWGISVAGTLLALPVQRLFLLK